MVELPDSVDRDVTEEVAMVTHTRDVDAIARALTDWLPHPLGAEGEVVVDDVHVPEGGGLSSVTVLAEATWTARGRRHRRGLVVRAAPDRGSFPVFPSYDLRLQYDVMAGVRGNSDVPVPSLLGIEESDRPMGAPFIVMEHVPGRVPLDNPPYVFCGWLYEATPAQRRIVQDATVDVIARIHAIMEPARRFPRLAAPGSDPLRQHVDQTWAYYQWTRRDDGLRIPVLERGFDWLERNWPTDPGEPVLNWGDARPGNVVYDELTPRAVLDWEMAALGPREIDLGWFVFIHRFFQDIAEGFDQPGLPDMARRDDVVATYESLTGHRVREFDWYILYAALRHGIVMSQIRRRMIHFGEAPVPDDVDDYVMHRAAIEKIMAGTYEWPTS